MNELHEFFNSVAKEKKKVDEEKIRFTPRVNINLSTDLSSFFGTVSEAKREHVIIAKRDSTKLNALKGFFDRLDHFENTLAVNIEKQKDGFDPEEVKYDVETPTPIDDEEFSSGINTQKDLVKREQESVSDVLTKSKDPQKELNVGSSKIQKDSDLNTRIKTEVDTLDEAVKNLEPKESSVPYVSPS